MPMRDQDTLSALTAGLSRACANAFWAHISMITFPTQWDNSSVGVFFSSELNIPDWWEQWRRGALGLSPALSERWASRSRGGISLHVYAHKHTHLGCMWCTRVWGKSCECTEPIPRASWACMCVCVRSVIAAFAVSGCLYLGVYAVGRRLESWLKLSDTVCSVEEEHACIVTDSGMKQGSAASLHWKQVLCPLPHIKNT